MTPSTTKQQVSKYWRSLEELENSSEFQEFLHREFPQAASEIPEGISRRRWMQIMGASFSLAAAQGCRWQTEKIAPFAERPEGYVPGAKSKFATNIEVAGQPRHLMVTCYDGRPIKVDGNPDHPTGQGGSDAYSQALTLSLYDPDRQSRVYERDARQAFAREWSDFEEFLRGVVERLAPKSGDGLAILMQPTHSLAVSSAIKRLVGMMPQVALFEYAPLSRDNDFAGSEMAFGKRVRTHYKLEQADVIACFDADLLSSFPDSAAHARAYADRREPNKEKNPAGMNRLYSVECGFSTTGAAAEHRLAVKSSRVPAVLARVRDAVAALAAGESPAELGDDATYADKFVSALAEDLRSAGGKSVVVVGPNQAPEAHAIAHELNSLLGNAGETVVYTDEPEPASEIGSLPNLFGRVAEKKVDTLLILGGNPVYDAPADYDVVGDCLQKVPHTIHLSEYDNETSHACQWSLPQAHALEAWDAVQGWGGTIGVGQPTIEPLLEGRSALEVLALLTDGPGASAMELVRSAVAEAAGAIDDEAWRKLLHDGFMPSETPPADAALVRNGFEPPEASQAGEEEGSAVELVFTPSSHTYDGRFANNGWLQETPDFITKLTWDNAALMAPATAKKLGAEQGELVTLTVEDGQDGRSIEAPVFLLPGHAEGAVSLALGYGRTAAGRVGGMIGDDGSQPRSELIKGQRGNWGRYLPVTPFWVGADPVGVDSYQIRTSDAMNAATGVRFQPTGRYYQLATTQNHHAIDELGLNETVRRSGELIREATLGTYEDNNEFAKNVGAHVPDVELFGELTHNRSPEGESVDGRAWGMAIDLNKCIGCNACRVACQAENNVPVVGKDQVARGREMHWLRIDRYFTGGEVRDANGEVALDVSGTPKIDFSNPRVAHEPMTCQHCETAPCEQVCPVAATVHSEEGLNDMVYNRCIGTRYCANNCPFKVRRFNFFHYTDRFDNANNELMRLVMNPEVTVRSRGVMEKCTYCTQRISAARIAAKSEGRAVRDGEMKTACQEACSTQAIVFGDLNDKESEVAAWHESERSYTLLDGLRLKPRTAYLARVLNPHPALEEFVHLPTHVNDHAHGEEHNGEHGHGHDDAHDEGHDDTQGGEEHDHAETEPAEA